MFTQKKYEKRRLAGHAILSLFAFLLCCSIGAWAQAAPADAAGTPFSIRATHLLGFPNTKDNCSGTLSIKDDALQFERDGKSSAEVKVGSIHGAFLGGESKQVGGVPMKVGKVAAPFGGGRVVSLFAHKKYDTLTLEYVDADGGIHGAIFQLNKGEAELVRNQLVARGASPNRDDKPTQASAAEVLQ